MECELCGIREASRKAEIEGVVLNVCERCTRYGKEIFEERKKEKEPIAQAIPETEKVPVEDFSLRVKKLREERKLSQEELAAKIKEKVSVIKRIEDGWVPEEKVIEKLEKFFRTKLTEEVSLETPKQQKHEQRKTLTLGDIVEIK